MVAPAKRRVEISYISLEKVAPSQTLILAHCSGNHGSQTEYFTSAEMDWTVVSAACLFFLSLKGLETIYQPLEEHISMCNIVCEFSLYYTSKCKVNLAGIRVKAVKQRNIKQIAHAEDAL